MTGRVDVTVTNTTGEPPLNLQTSGFLSNGSVNNLKIGLLSAGTYNVAATFRAQGNFAASSKTVILTVSATPTTTTISAPTITSDVNGLITVNVASVAGTVTGNVDLTVDGTPEGSETLTDGSAIFTVSGLSVGSHNLSASYTAQGDFKASSDTGTLTVISPLQFSNLTSPTFLYGQATTPLGGNIGSGTTYPSGATVAITLNNVTENAQVQSNGSFSVAFPTASLGVGTYTVGYNFPKSTTFGAVTGTSTATVKPASPKFSNLSAPTISNGSATTTLGGHIGFGTAYPTSENVQITVNGTKENAPVDANGNFSIAFPTASLPVATYPITYYYAGDANFASATDSSQNLTVGSTTLAFDFSKISGANPAATLQLNTTTGMLEVVSGGNVVETSRSLSSTQNITIAGEGNDSLTIDLTNSFSEPITLSFTGAGNTLTIIGGSGAFSAGTYNPTAEVSGAGQVQVGGASGSSIAFSGLASLAVSKLSSFTLTTPAGGNNVSIDSPSTGVNSVSGTSAGTAFVPVTFSSVPAVTLDTSVKDSASSVDTVIIQSSGLVATGLQNFTLKTDQGNNMLLDYADSFSLPGGGTFAFTGTTNGANTFVGPNPTLASNVQFTNVTQSLPVPIIVIPGFTASFATAASASNWFSTIGLPPSEMQLDPFENTYADLVATLLNEGYVDNPNPGQVQTLFQAAWDWRLPLAPQDNTVDGKLSNLTATKLTGDGYQDAVDYLGSALVSAAQSRAANFNGRSLPALDVVTHSTGALLPRAYVQSAAYGQTLSAGQTLSTGGTLSSNLVLPEINDAVMMAPPNQGAAQIWNLLNNNYGADLEDRGVSLIIGASYAYVKAGGTITSPNGNITLASITDNNTVPASIQTFLNLYAPSLYDLLPTFPFLEIGNAPLAIGANGIQNNLLLDLNDGLGLTPAPANSDPNSFLDSPTNSMLGKLYITSSDGTQTKGLVITNGSLTYLDASISTNFAIDAVTFNATGLEFTYNQSQNEYTVSGQAGVEVAGVDNLSVTFGYGSTPGLDIVDGSLTGLNMTIDSNISVDKVTFQTNGLEFTYTDTDQNPSFSLQGEVGVTVGSIDSLSVNFVGQGLVISGGALQNLRLRQRWPGHQRGRPRKSGCVPHHRHHDREGGIRHRRPGVQIRGRRG